MTEQLRRPKPHVPRSAAQIICDPLLLSSQFLCSARQLDPKAESPQVASEIRQQLDQLRAGDLSAIEARLVGQILMLENFGADCLLKAQALIASGELVRHESTVQMLAHLSLRSQDQVRRTIGTLNELKSPKRSTTFIRSQNNQLNQFLLEENAHLRNQLGLGGSTNAAMDTSSQTAAQPTHETVATVDLLDRPAH